MAIQEPKNSVGVRELHAHTSKLIKAVAETRSEIAITVHGERVAKIVPIDKDDPVERLRELGMIREPTARSKFVPKPIKLAKGATVSDIVIEHRKDED